MGRKATSRQLRRPASGGAIRGCERLRGERDAKTRRARRAPFDIVVITMSTSVKKVSPPAVQSTTKLQRAAAETDKSASCVTGLGY